MKSSDHKKQFFVGCSGYYYPQWKYKFYPKGTAVSRWLEYYSSVFNTVELNGTFYKLPSLSTLKKYYGQVPDDFRFTVKVSRYITHMLKLRNCEDKVKEFTDLILSGLDDKLDNLLFQLPPSYKYSEENLEYILKMIPSMPMSVIEFRDISWWDAKIEKLLKGYDYTFCNTDYPGLEQTFTKTNKRFYARMHGVPLLFKSPYSKKSLETFTENLPKRCERYYIYFNNTDGGAAYQDAVYLKELLGPTFL